MKTLKLIAIALVTLSFSAATSFAGPSATAVTTELNAEKSTCSTKQFGKRFYDHESDSVIRHCSQK